MWHVVSVMWVWTAARLQSHRRFQAWHLGLPAMRPHSIDAMLMRADGRDAVMVAPHSQAEGWRPAACTITGTNGRTRWSARQATTSSAAAAAAT
jgi:hypothetical protein